MQNVGSVLKYISSQKFQLSPGLLTFHNYLQHLHGEDETWSPSILTHFFNDCLQYPHWIQNRVSLTEDLQQCLQQYQVIHQANLGLEHVRWPNETQVVEVETKRDFADLINSFLTFQYQKTGSKFRLVHETEKMVFAVILHPDRSLTVRQFDRKFTMREGHLEPLRTDLEVHYDSELNLEEDLHFKLEVAPFVTCRFMRTGEVVSASLVRGYICQKFHEFKMAPIESYPRLFYTLKRIEQTFLRRESDPFYVQLTQDLERTLNLLRHGEPLDPAQVTDLQVRSQNALEYVFHGDKLLRLLLRDLENQMAAPRPQNRASASTPELRFGNLSHLDFVQDAREAGDSKWNNDNPKNRPRTPEFDSTN
ncbi:MAG: hypothetical protein KF681_06510 [Bdellovibrionaceae bacterium]|nr:hypothetical protein [Pseudobdellovibrionaceae bacterium]